MKGHWLDQDRLAEEYLQELQPILHPLSKNLTIRIMSLNCWGWPIRHEVTMCLRLNESARWNQLLKTVSKKNHS